MVVNALALLIAAAILPDMEIEVGPFIFAVILFTILTLVIPPILRMSLKRFSPSAMGAVSLVATWPALLITDVFSDGVQIEGFWTWAAATLIVWLGIILLQIGSGIFLGRRAKHQVAGA